MAAEVVYLPSVADVAASMPSGAHVQTKSSSRPWVVLVGGRVMVDTRGRAVRFATRAAAAAVAESWGKSLPTPLTS